MGVREMLVMGVREMLVMCEGDDGCEGDVGDV